MSPASKHHAIPGAFLGVVEGLSVLAPVNGAANRGLSAGVEGCDARDMTAIAVVVVGDVADCTAE